MNHVARHGLSGLALLLVLCPSIVFADVKPDVAVADTLADDEDESDTAPESPSTATEKPATEAELSVSHRGRVTYTETHVSVPLSSMFSVIPNVALMRVAAPNERATFNTYLGAGLAFRPVKNLELSLGGSYGPRSFGLTTVGGELGATLSLFGDPENDKPAVVEAHLELSALRYAFDAEANESSQKLTQFYVDVSADVHLGKGWTLSPGFMWFAYAGLGTAEQTGDLGTLATVGSFAPKAMASLEVSYLIRERIEPYVQVARILYAADIGYGNELFGGVKAHLSDHYTLGAAGGILQNKVTQSVVASDDDGTLVPIVQLNLNVSY